MIRNCVKFSKTPKINSLYFILSNKTCNLHWSSTPSVCSHYQNKFYWPNAVQSTALKPSSFNVVKYCMRFKSKDQKSKIKKDDSDSEEEDDQEEIEYDEDGNKLRQLKIRSMRVDNVLGKCLGLSRRKIEELFLGSRLRLNGQPLAKKSIDLKSGDSLEICTEPVDTGGTTEVVTKMNVIKIRPSDDALFYMTFSVDKRQ